jgi:hypothetical protein
VRRVCVIVSVATLVALGSQCALAVEWLADDAAGCEESLAADCGAVPYGCCDPCGDACCDERCCCILPSDHCFDRFISPLSNPFYFEDPRSLSEVRGMFIDNDLPRSLGGNDAQVWAGQFRARVTDRVSIIAPRLGYIEVNQPEAPNGFMSTPIGLKYNLYRDPAEQRLLSIGTTYFIPGEEDAFSNFGDGDFHFFLSGGTEIFDYGHWISGTGFRIPTDHNWGTQMWYWSNQWDYEVVDNWYGLVGVNWFHWLNSGGIGADIPITGLDLLDLPASGVAGKDVVTGVVGGKWKPGRHVEIGAGYEFPMTSRTDLLDDRFYADLIFRF